MENIDSRIRDAFSVWEKIDEIDVKILEGLSLLGPRNIALLSKHIDHPISTVSYRIRRMLDKSVLFFHVNPYHTYMGLKKAVIFVEAILGYEDVLLDCLRVNDFWLLLCRVYGPYEGCGGIWTIPKEKAEDFEDFIQSLIDKGIARSAEINWSTCFEGIPVQTRWFNNEQGQWTFNWDELLKEVEIIEGKLPITLIDPPDWPIRVDYTDLLIIKELEIDGRKSLSNISRKLDIPLEKIKYHFREHVSKRGLLEGYQIEIYRFPSLVSEYIFFKFEFDTYEQFAKFTLSLHDKPFPIFMGKVLGENALITQVYLPKWEFRKFIAFLSELIKKGLLSSYYYVLEDAFQMWRETIPYDHFKDGKWDYDSDLMKKGIKKVLQKWKLD